MPLSHAGLVAERVEVIRLAIQGDCPLEVAVHVLDPTGQVQPDRLFKRARTSGQQRSRFIQALQSQQALNA